MLIVAPSKDSLRIGNRCREVIATGNLPDLHIDHYKDRWARTMSSWDTELTLRIRAHHIEIALICQQGCMTQATWHITDEDIEAAETRHFYEVWSLASMAQLKLRVDPKLTMAVLTPNEDLCVTLGHHMRLLIHADKSPGRNLSRFYCVIG